MGKTLLSSSSNKFQNPILKIAILGLFLFFQHAHSQTVVIGGGTTSGSGPISVQPTGTSNQSRSVHVVRKSSLLAAGVTPGSAIFEWGYKKTTTSELVGSNQWELKVYLKNVTYNSVVGSLFESLGNGATLVRQEIVNQDMLPVESSYWMWQMQNYFEYTGNDILCIVEWNPLQNVYNNVTSLMRWEQAPFASAVTLTPSSSVPTTATAVPEVGYSTRISFVKGLFAGTVTGGTITASVANANAGAPFALLSSNLSYGADMEYQYQKSPAGLNAWTNIGPESVLSSLPAVLQDTPTDYRLRSTCMTSGQSAFSNIVSVGQKSNVVFTDPNLKTAFVRADPTTNNVKNLAGAAFKPDVDNDGEIQLSEALGVGKIEFISTTTAAIGGLESFHNLTKLSFYLEANFSDVAVPPLANLQWLEFTTCSVDNITFGALPQLDVLRLSNNNISSVNLENMPVLRQLVLANNMFTTFTTPVTDTFQILSIQNNSLTNLTAVSGLSFDELDCSNNQLTSLHVVSTKEPMGTVKCNNNQLTSLTFDVVQGVGYVECNTNQLQSLDFSNITLQSLDCSNNDLQSLLIRNRWIENTLNFAGNPNLAYICVDYPQITTVKDLATAQGYPQMSVNDYCSFNPVGDWYILGGNSRYSATGNCDSNSIVYPYLKLAWSATWDSGPEFLGNFYTNSLGELNEQLPSSYPSILEPKLEYPEYFNVSPAPFAFNFTPAPTTPINQDFCITPNGVHNDIQVRIFPLGEARPGFNATYRILLRNVGTEPSSGQITLDYEEPVMDFVSAYPAPSTTGLGQLGWSYSDLQPFEARTLYLSFNLNPSTGSSPLAIGDVLDFHLEATSAQTDVNPVNNNHYWRQGVVNSFDPNDKTCLEGSVLGPSQVGDFVHYVIRFENTGNASAVNVVVKDIFDAQRFDINSLTVLDSSHPMRLRQRGNSYEFIFENINLPFTGDQAKGFVIFKVRLLNNLVLGDTFSNQAGIYFDYNLPIITNNETTVIQELGTGDFTKDASVAIYPNPAYDLVMIKSDTDINSVELYDLQGRLLETQLGNGNLIDFEIARRATGIYYLKIRTQAGMSVQKLIKK